MTNHGFDRRRVTWSAPWDDATVDGACPLKDGDPNLPYNYGTGTCDCLNVWGDYARQSNLDAIYSAIGGGRIGVPLGPGYGVYGGLGCGGINDNLVPVLMYNGEQPSIVDSHMYPSTFGGTTDQHIQQAAALDYSNLAHFFTLPGMQSALVMIGETHDFRICPDYPASAPYSNAAGFNQSVQTLGSSSLVSGRSVVMRPFMNLGGPCYPYGLSTYQNENYNWSGPYNPSRYNQ
jgi:hypothetical protein